jgi:alpha-D-xyloside xylohydrolase
MHVMMGVSGYKIDECDGSELTNNAWMFPEHTRFPSGRDGEQLRQIYGMLMQRMTAELFRKNDRRTYGLVRASNAGATSLPYALYSDLSDHKEYVRALINSSYSGLLWAPELRSAHSPELFVRRLQLACFSPLMMMDAWHTEVFPWSFPTVTPIVTKYIQLRMRLLPYFYSAFARYRFEGIPPFRAMNLDYGDDEHVRNHDYDDQYLAGDHLLIAPMFEGNYSRTVYLPPGDWYDFDTNRRYHGAKCIEVVPGLDSIPVFVRAGAILPLMPPLTHAPKPGDNVPIEVRCYGKRHHSFMLYDDDGETYRFEQGEYQWIKLSVEYKEKNVPEGFVHRQEHPPSVGCYHAFTWKFIQ